MPRISIFDEQTRENDHRDYCQRHFKRAGEDLIEKYGDAVDLDVEHPSYEDFGDYKCRTCRTPLTDKDN